MVHIYLKKKKKGGLWCNHHGIISCWSHKFVGGWLESRVWESQLSENKALGNSNNYKVSIGKKKMNETEQEDSETGLKVGNTGVLKVKEKVGGG